MSEPQPPGEDRFERAYAAGITDAPPVLAGEARREELEGQARAVPGEPFALRGLILTPDEALEDAYVVISGSAIAEVTGERPEDVRTFDTQGVVLPGLIDLHGHPEYNVFAAWEPPKLYANRYRWRDSDEYREVIKDPWALLTDDTPEHPTLLRTMTRYAEARALFGGVTAIQGASGMYPDPQEALTRNVDRYIFGEHRARSIIDLDRERPEDLARRRAQIASGEVRALYIHLAEGIDDTSRREFEELVELELLTEATVIIHGTALTPDQLEAVREAGASLVWSPQSNLRLYGGTTDAAHALTLGIPTALGADWLPSGSPSLLDELQVARRVLRQQGSRVEPKRLVGMVTAEAARVAGLGDKLGRIRAGVPADLVVLERLREDPWESVLASDRRAVELVTIGGDVAYGRRDWMEAIAGPTELEPLVAWGEPMALDLSYSVLPFAAPPPRLAELRTLLLARYSHTGPIFA